MDTSSGACSRAHFDVVSVAPLVVLGFTRFLRWRLAFSLCFYTLSFCIFVVILGSRLHSGGAKEFKKVYVFDIGTSARLPCFLPR
jgi:hypothetical protein